MSCHVMSCHECVVRVLANLSHCMCYSFFYTCPQTNKTDSSIKTALLLYFQFCCQYWLQLDRHSMLKHSGLIDVVVQYERTKPLQCIMRMVCHCSLVWCDGIEFCLSVVISACSCICAHPLTPLSLPHSLALTSYTFVVVILFCCSI
jgi:hypothetical protein